MTFKSNIRRTRTALGSSLVVAAAIVALPSAANAQVTYPMSDAEVQSLPPQYQTGPAVQNYAETTVDADGIETITRTRRIESTAPVATHHTAQYPGGPVHTPQTGHAGYTQGYAQGYAPAAAVFQRDQWLEECEDRTRGRGDRETGGIIGGLLGAISGGIIGNRAFSSERLGGTLLGGGLGGVAGVLLGSLIGGGRDDRGSYDCEAALDSYLSQYGYPGAAPVQRVAVRSIPAPTYAPQYAAPVQYGYGYAPTYQQTYTYAPPQQVVYVPVHYQQQQRVIVRETVREEMVPVPGATRTIPAPAPRPVAPPAPRPVQPRYIKGN